MRGRDAYRLEVFTRPWAHTAPNAFGIVPGPFRGIRAYLAEIEILYYAGWP